MSIQRRVVLLLLGGWALAEAASSGSEACAGTSDGSCDAAPTAREAATPGRGASGHAEDEVDEVFFLQKPLSEKSGEHLIELVERAPMHSLSKDSIIVSTGTPAYNMEGSVQDVPEGSPVSTFLGIPYSKSRAPPNRFQPPEEYEHAAGSTFQALQQGDACVDGRGRGSEDCLKLDVYAPFDQSQHYPVMIWIHGGSWQYGSKNDYAGRLWAGRQWYAGAPRIVLVTVNYRMNILGFPDLDGAAKNLGVLDLIMALKWVGKHIGDFGGDASSVTIFGESAGAMNVLALWASPEATGLFHRAIAQSPYLWDWDQGTSSELRPRAQKMSAMSTCMQNACHGASPCTLQTPTLGQLVTAGCFGPWYGPMSDGSVIANDFLAGLCSGGGQVPLLVGNNALEIGLWITYGRYAWKEVEMKRWIQDLLETDEAGSECVFSQLGQMYGATGMMRLEGTPHPQEERERHYAASGIMFNMFTEVLSRHQNAHQYLFNESFSHTFFGMCEDGAHACEVPYVIGEETKYDDTGAGKAGTYSADSKLEGSLQQRMRAVWAEFAVTGNPGWGADAIGKFANGALEVDSDGAPFTPEISQALYNMMCSKTDLSISTTC